MKSALPLPFHLLALGCQVCLLIWMAVDYTSSHDKSDMIGALGWLAAASYNLGNMITRTE